MTSLPTGSIVALVTPFHEDGTVNTEKLKELVEFHISSGTDGILVLGTTGESSTMTEERAGTNPRTRTCATHPHSRQHPASQGIHPQRQIPLPPRTIQRRRRRFRRHTLAPGPHAIVCRSRRLPDQRPFVGHPKSKRRRLSGNPEGKHVTP